jgi:predicted deacetylase
MYIAGMRNELPFRIELWDEGFNRLLDKLAAAGDHLTAKAAYDTAVRRRPGEPIMLRDRARVILKSR